MVGVALVALVLVATVSGNGHFQMPPAYAPPPPSYDYGGNPSAPPPPPPPPSSSPPLDANVNNVNEVNNMEHLTRYWGNVRPDALVIHSGGSGAFLPGQQGLFPPHMQPGVPGAAGGGRACYEPSYAEQQSVGLLKHYVANSGTQSPWLRGASDVELLRFLRARKADVAATWQMLWEHSLWRMNPSQSGADTLGPSDHQYFERSTLNQEMYWAGLASDGNPVLVFRSAFHQSNVDPSMFSRFVVWQLEKGKRLYGVGVQRQIYIVVDRSPSKTGPMMGPGMVTSTLPLLKTVFKVVQDNYPEVLCKAYVAPVNAITRMLFSAVSSVIDEKIRGKISLIKADDSTWWHGTFHPTLIPRDLGGWSDGYRPAPPAPPSPGVSGAPGAPQAQQQFQAPPPPPPPPPPSAQPDAMSQHQHQEQQHQEQQQQYQMPPQQQQQQQQQPQPQFLPPQPPHYPPQPQQQQQQEQPYYPQQQQPPPPQQQQPPPPPPPSEPYPQF